LKAFTSVLIASLLFLSIHKDALIILSFNINQDYIAKNFCVKKNEVHNTCCGKCYLKKQLTKNQEQEKNKTLPLTENKTQPLFHLFNIVHCNCASFDIERTKILQINDPISSFLFPSEIFHPPKI